MTDTPTPEEVADHCDGPETCIDDLCRWAERGLCGRWRDDRVHDDDEYDDDEYDDDEYDDDEYDDDEIGADR